MTTLPSTISDTSEPILIHLGRMTDKRATASRMHEHMGAGHPATVASAKRYHKSRVALEGRIRELLDSHNKLAEVTALLSA